MFDDGDYDLMMMTMSILEVVEKEEKYILNFRGLMSSMITVTRIRIQGHIDVYKNYFKVNPVYHEGFFWRNYQMRRHLFFQIMEGAKEYNPYLTLRKDCTVALSFSPL